MIQSRSIVRVSPVSSLGALLGASLLASAPQAAHALPIVRAQAIEPPGLMLVQAQRATPTDPRERMPFVELNAALEAARSKLEELTGAAEIAALTTALREEVEQIRRDNRRLGAELEKANGALAEAAEKLDAAEGELAAKDQALAQQATKGGALVRAAERAATEAARLREELKAREQRLETAEAARKSARDRLAEAEAALHKSSEEADRLRAQLATTQQELAGVTAQLAKADREAGEARTAADTLRAKTDDLQQELISARGEVERLDAENVQFEAEIAQLRDAADSAAAAARDNLIAVEDKIRTLNDVLADIVQEPVPGGSDSAKPAGAEGKPPADPRAAPASFGVTSAAAATGAPGSDAPVLPPTPAQQVRQLAAAAAPGRGGAIPAPASVEPERDATPPHRSTLVELAADLPLEERFQVENLLADLKATPHRQGVLLTVPGGDLFELDGDEIGERAHEPLAKVAELISIYADRQVLIMGHTDAMGEADYNKMLSERRADLVRQFFVDQFEIEAARLATAGLGEERPIASNATRAGREANRRVEVLIMN